MIRKKVFLIISIGVFFISSCQPVISSWYLEMMPQCDLGLNKDMEAQFTELLPEGIELNSNIKLKQISTNFPLVLHIYNYSSESVEFSDRAFSAQGYWPDSKNHQWVEVKIPFAQMENSVTLPPNLTHFDPEIINELAFFESTLTQLGYDQLRIFVSGNGSETGNIYGAYLDICIDKH